MISAVRVVFVGLPRGQRALGCVSIGALVGHVLLGCHSLPHRAHLSWVVICFVAAFVAVDLVFSRVLRCYPRCSCCPFWRDAADFFEVGWS